ncbi:MAG: FHA domain-containing protein [Planctomycetota bacterium]
MKDQDELPRTADLRTNTSRLSVGEFVKAHPRPALHLALQVNTSGKSAPADGKTTQEKSYERTAVIPAGSTSVQRYNDRIAFLGKRAGNPFPNMISVGRALNNDLVVVLSTVSKLHGYFLCEGPTWTFIDHGSKNGTKINDAALAKNERKALAPGDRIQLGLELSAIFLTPEKLYDFLRRSSSGV